MKKANLTLKNVGNRGLQRKQDESHHQIFLGHRVVSQITAEIST